MTHKAKKAAFIQECLYRENVDKLLWIRYNVTENKKETSKRHTPNISAALFDYTIMRNWREKFLAAKYVLFA